MILTVSKDPVVTDALRQWRGREHFPTEFGSADLRGLSRELRERSIFSARTTNADYLQEVSEVVDKMLSGDINLATGRWMLMKKLKQLGYDPAKGFPQDMADVPPAEKGSLQDLSSEQRIDLMLETNLRMAAGYGQMMGGMKAYALYAYPGWELVRLYQRVTPRGTVDSHTVGWQRRWSDAGGAVEWVGAVGPGKMPGQAGGTPALPESGTAASSGRMIARKDSPIWAALGDGAGGYRDTLSNPYPPFAFRSGMAWKAVARKECEQFGLLGGGAQADTRGARATHATLSPGVREVKEAMAKLGADFKRVLIKGLKGLMGKGGEL